MQRQCKVKTAKGKRCTMPALKGSQYCFTHDPAHQAERARARKLGGFNRRTAARVSGDEPIKIESTADVLKLINAVIADTWAQDNGAARSRALLACADVAIKALTMTDLEVRIAALEQAQRVKDGDR
jgi:hypothetical protein